jgi:photosystem II stability/assembly factor-like uncharacterized protein
VARKAGSGSWLAGKRRRTKLRPGLPKPESITGQRTFASPRGAVYRILSTDEKDAYEVKTRKTTIGGDAIMGKGKAKKRTVGSKIGRKSAPKPKSASLLRRPTRLTGKTRLPDSDESGPLDWLKPVLSSTYNPLSESTAAPITAHPDPAIWRDTFLEYKRRKAAVVEAPAVSNRIGPAMAFVPGARNWLPLGPTVVLHGQTVGNQPVAGRVAGLAIAPGGSVIYAATANGGVFRSSDGGTTWRSTMDRFDLNPASFASTSLICGAVAIDPADPNRVYVGTGEGDTFQLFRMRVVSALPAYRGVGPLRSDDGGTIWTAESSTPDLAGEAFFALAVDPHNRENVIGATTVGLYQRVPKTGGGFEWVRRVPGVHSSVVATANGASTRFFAALWGQAGQASAIVYSDDGGKTWQPAGKSFPAVDAGRVSLALQGNRPNPVYAFVATRSTGAAHGLYRLNSIADTWRSVANLPPVLPLNGGRSQGDYDLAVAVDPSNPDLVFLGGSYADVDPYPASVWRCPIKAAGQAYKVVNSASIGTRAHADVHALVFTPDDPTELWCTCDGGVFLNRDPAGHGEFASQNNSLACLCCNFIAQHPTDPNILFTGMQDNGTAQTETGPIWTHVMGGDGGYCVVNWANPKQVLVYANGRVYRSTTGGKSEAGWSPVWNFGWATMTQPIVTTPYRPTRPADAQVVAVAAGEKVFVSTNFAASWPTTFEIPADASTGEIFALVFASPKRLFAGTTRGRVFRADLVGSAWKVVRIDNAAAGSINLDGQINDLAVDWSDAGLKSIYLAFGGLGDRRRVWRFDGQKWAVRSGPPGGKCLLDVEHNAIAVDPKSPKNIYVGADIGVWHSADAGMTWDPLENGLPDAPVFDLQIHPTQRLLRAATYGRGIYELPL